MDSVVAEPLVEGWLVKGTLDVSGAIDLVVEQRLCTEGDIASTSVGYFRKRPAQWSDFSLYKADGPGRGAFPAVILYHDGRKPTEARKVGTA